MHFDFSALTLRINVTGPYRKNSTLLILFLLLEKGSLKENGISDTWRKTTTIGKHGWNNDIQFFVAKIIQIKIYF